MSNKLIELKNLTKNFDDQQVLRGINLDIHENEFLTLLGPSGCGKTTTLRIIAGFEEPSGGEVLFNGIEISKLPPYKREINTVFQKYALFPHLNVMDNIGFGLNLKKVDKSVIEQKVKRMLKMVGLEGFEKRDVTLLSGVQQQEKIYTVQMGDTLWSIAQKNDLTFRELCELNPSFKGAQLNENSNIQAGDELIVTKQEAMLEVRITKVETWQEEIPYSTETTTSNEYTVGTKKTVQNGVNGLRQITAQRVYNTDGIQLSQKILSTEVVQEPVTEKIVKGTKKVTNSTTYITGSGQFIWPVPGYRYCSRWYGSGHKGVDICAAAGTPIYASAGGTVTKAGYNKAGAGTGYGYSVIISHGSGYTTVYAHCLSLAVHSGQSVKQGQLIGYVGSTGRSSGNHCHFEIRRNGSYIAPQNVFNRSKYR